MYFLVDHPIAAFIVTFLVLWLSARIGVGLRNRHSALEEAERSDFGVILAAMLTLLGLIIGFTFSMASTRYDQRKNYEEQEANAIGTEYLRADFLPATDAAKVRELLRSYLEQRILFYTSHGEQLQQVNATTSKLQAQLWGAVKIPTTADRSPILALALAGMNDVLNSQGYTQAAWWNRIPLAAWGLMWAIAICCNVMVGYYVLPTDRNSIRLVLPIIIAVAFLLIADIDSPRRGVIRVHPQNLISLANSLPPQ